MPYKLNFIRNSNQGLALIWKKQILRSNRHKHLQKQSNEDFFINYLMPDYISPITTSLRL